MLMFTRKELTAHEEAVAKAERARIAALMRQKAEEHPKWEVHDLLKALADSIDPPPADSQV